MWTSVSVEPSGAAALTASSAAITSISDRDERSTKDGPQGGRVAELQRGGRTEAAELPDQRIGSALRTQPADRVPDQVVARAREAEDRREAEDPERHDHPGDGEPRGGGSQPTWANRLAHGINAGARRVRTARDRAEMSPRRAPRLVPGGVVRRDARR